MGMSAVKLEAIVGMVAHHISARPRIWPGKALSLISAQRGNPQKEQGPTRDGVQWEWEPRGNVCMQKSLPRNEEVPCQGQV